MKTNSLFPIVLALLRLFTEHSDAGRNDKVLLTKIKTLTLRNDQVTTGRRSSPISQLKCVGGDGKGLYEVDVMRCTNMGSDYGDEDVSWSCTADVPKYFKLGSTDVLCEGYSGPDDPYVLKGSCGVEYRLALTDDGYEKYGGGFLPSTRLQELVSVFSIIFWAVVCLIIYSAYTTRNNPQGPMHRPTAGRNNGRPWFGGGGNDDPPPPYDPQPPRYKSTFTGATEQGWRPGFWTGMATGAAGSYLVGNRNRDDNANYGYRSSRPSGLFSGGSSFAESSSAGASRHETTGFGQTRRR
ncbi:hypothetical protein BDD12DRAFT_759940 [Trichophaea hybrida]|nr:hypothetical protein BDD12DRAFT_759940 [Trichophaea hybrida]